MQRSRLLGGINKTITPIGVIVAVRKGLEPALRAETLSTLPPADSVSCPLGGLEVEGV